MGNAQAAESRDGVTVRRMSGWPHAAPLVKGFLRITSFLLAAAAASAAIAQDFPRTAPAVGDAISSRVSIDDAKGVARAVAPDFGNVRAQLSPPPVTKPRPAKVRATVEPNRPRGARKGAVATADSPYMTSSGGGVPRLDARIAIARDARAVAQAPLALLGQVVEPNHRVELRWEVGQSFDGGATFTPVTVIHGRRPGPTLCLIAAIHGDELNGIEVVRRVLNEIKPKDLRGTVIGVPIVNLFGFARGTRNLPDRRDLNRYFPGSHSGSAASRIARRFLDQVVRRCDALVDFHTGSFARSNLPQVRADLTADGVVSFTRGFGAIPVLHSPGARGMLRRAASDLGIAAATFEVGAPGLLEPDEIDKAAQSIHTLMHRLGMTRSYRMWSEPQAVLYASRWVRSNAGGMLFSTAALGDRVRVGQRLGKVVDPVNNRESEIVSPLQGRVIGIALNQLVLPGFAAYHIGVERSESTAVQEAARMPHETRAAESMDGEQFGENGETSAPVERAAIPAGGEIER